VFLGVRGLRGGVLVAHCSSELQRYCGARPCLCLVGYAAVVSGMCLLVEGCFARSLGEKGVGIDEPVNGDCRSRLCSLDLEKCKMVVLLVSCVSIPFWIITFWGGGKINTVQLTFRTLVTVVFLMKLSDTVNR
jgi:hypothetical protein